MYEDAPQMVRNFLTQKQAIERKSDITVKEYYYDLRLFFKYMKFKFDKKTGIEQLNEVDVSGIDLEFINKITLMDIYDFLMYLSTEKKLGARTLARRIAAIKSFFKYLHIKAKLIDKNPTEGLDSPRIVKSMPRYLELNESKELLLSVCGKNKERDFAILTLFLNCGLRLSELCGINLSDIKKDRMTIIGKGNKERMVYLNNACQNAIASYLKVRPSEGLRDKNALFISSQKRRIYHKTVQYLVKKYIEMSGLDSTKYSTHKLRHTAATLMYRHGKVDVRALQEILGHEHLNTTQIYTHVDDVVLKSAMESNPLAGFGKERADKDD